MRSAYAKNIKFFNFSLTRISTIPNIVYCNEMELGQDIFTGDIIEECVGGRPKNIY